jgi:hypothetical protein
VEGSVFIRRLRATFHPLPTTRGETDPPGPRP